MLKSKSQKLPFLVWVFGRKVPDCHGQPKLANFVAVGIPILDMMETPTEAWKYWKPFI